MARPRITTFVEPYNRTSIEWTPQLIRHARLLAESGNLRLAADLVEDLLLPDAKVSGCLDQRVLGGLSLELEFDSDGDKRKKNRVEAALETDFWRMYPESDLSQFERWALLLGVGLARQRWEPGGEEHKGRWLARLEVWHPRNLRWDWNLRQWRLLVNGGQEIIIEPGDGTWLLYTPYGQNRPWSWAPWRKLALWALAKSYARSDWGRGSEVAGGIRSAKWMGDKTPPGDCLKERTELAQDLSEIGRDASLVPLPGWELYVVETGPTTHQTHQGLIEVANAEIAVALTGQTLSSGTDSGGAGLGTGGASTLHENVRQDLIDFDAKNRATFLHDQSLVWWAQVNFGSKRLAPWAKWNTSPAEDEKDKAETWNTAATALKTFQDAGLAIDREEFAEAFGIPLDEDADPQEAPAEGDAAAPPDAVATPGAPQAAAPSAPAAPAAPRAAEPPPTPPAPKPKARLAAGATTSNGAMVCFYLDPQDAQALALPGGEDPAGMHCTLCYLGEAADLTPAQQAAAQSVCQDMASQTAQLSGQLGGLGRFAGSESSDWQDALYASVNAPGLARFREEMARRLAAAGVPLSQTFDGYTPHVTLAYLDPTDEMPMHRLAPRPVRFGSLSLSVGGQRQDFPLCPPAQSAMA